MELICASSLANKKLSKSQPDPVIEQFDLEQCFGDNSLLNSDSYKQSSSTTV